MIDLTKVKSITEELLSNMTIADFTVDVLLEDTKEGVTANNIEGMIMININLVEPQFLIGQDGKTLIDLQKVLRMMLNKQAGKGFYVKLDINNYQKQKIEYLKNLARSSADEAVSLQEKKTLPPMSAYERRIIHEELSNRQDIISQSQGDQEARYIIISPK